MYFERCLDIIDRFRINHTQSFRSKAYENNDNDSSDVVLDIVENNSLDLEEGLIINSLKGVLTNAISEAVETVYDEITGDIDTLKVTQETLKSLVDSIYIEVDEVDDKNEFLDGSFKKEIIIGLNLFFENLNYSILEGEYVIDNFGNIIENGLKKIQEIVDSISLAVTSYEEDSDYYIILEQCALNPIKLCLQKYKELSDRLFEKVIRSDKFNFLYEIHHRGIDTDSLDLFQMTFVNDQVNYIIDFNIKLAIIDLELSIDDDIAPSLLSLNHRINRSGSAFKEILSGKCSALLYKVLKRYEKDTNNFTYSIDFVDKQVDIENFFNESSGYKPFLKLVNLHYDETNFTSKHVNEFAEIIRNLKGEKRSSCTDFHGAMKYYKDLNIDDSKLLEITEYFPEIPDDKYKEFNRRANIVSKQYSDNNILSVKLEKYEIFDQTENSYLNEFHNTLDTAFKNYYSRQLENRNMNYFPYFKMLSVGLKGIEALYADFEIYKHKINKFLDLFDKMEKQLFLATEWCKDRHYIAFSSYYQDCIVKYKHKGKNINLFLYSSCILPINYRKQRKDNDNISFKLKELHSLFVTKSSVAIDKKELELSRRKVEENERKNIEILSVFAAIVLFVTSNISLYSQIEYFSQGLLFMLVMGYVIVLMILCVWMITRDPGFYKDKSVHAGIAKIPTVHKYLIGIIVLATIIIGSISFKDFSKREVSFKKDYEVLEYKINTLKQINTEANLIDSSKTVVQRRIIELRNEIGELQSEKSVLINDLQSITKNKDELKKEVKGLEDRIRKAKEDLD